MSDGLFLAASNSLLLGATNPIINAATRQTETYVARILRHWSGRRDGSMQLPDDKVNIVARGAAKKDEFCRSLLSERFAHRLRGVAVALHQLAQPLLADAERLGPIANFPFLAQCDAAGVLRGAVFQIVGNCRSFRS